MPSAICAVVGCHNGTIHLKQWHSERCPIHVSHNGRGRCLCPPPFRLLPFPTTQKQSERDIWAKNVHRQVTMDRSVKLSGDTVIEQKRGDAWIPAMHDRICSAHFVDGKPTKQNPYPTVNMGYTLVKGKSAAKRYMHHAAPSAKTKKKLIDVNSHASGVTAAESVSNAPICTPGKIKDNSLTCEHSNAINSHKSDVPAAEGVSNTTTRTPSKIKDNAISCEYSLDINSHESAVPATEGVSNAAKRKQRRIRVNIIKRDHSYSATCCDNSCCLAKQGFVCDLVNRINELEEELALQRFISGGLT